MCTLKKVLVSNRPPVLESVGGVVYCVPCSDCGDSYIGQTGREFDIRLNEHKSAVRLKNLNNACAKHVAEYGHSIDWNNAKPVYKCSELSNRLVVESALIKTFPNFNNMHSSITLENLAAETIVKFNLGLQPPD